MVAKNQQEAIQMVNSFITPWHTAVGDQAKAQEEVLQNLLKSYARTEYGKQHGAGSVGSLADYRKAFPVVNYEGYKPLINRVMAGEVNLLLDEPPVGWAITRGTTKGESKFIPITPAVLRLQVTAGRAMLNFVAATKRFDLFAGVNLNLNFPSRVGTVKVGEREIEYGYSSGIYTRIISTSTPIRSVPSQAEIDALGGGKTIHDWDKRFEQAYQKCKTENVTLVGGVVSTAIHFARYIHR